MNTIHAVIWNDFIPLSLICLDADMSIKTAKNIAERAPHIDYIRAVELTGDDKLITLWEKE